MLHTFKLILISFISILVLSVPDSSWAQVIKKNTHHSLRDSLRLQVMQRDSMMRSFKHSKGSLNILLGKIEDYTTSYVETNADLARGFDTLDISERLPTLEKRMVSMRTIITNSTTLGNLVTIRGMIDHLKDQLDSWEKQLNLYNTRLEKTHADIDAFKADTALHTAPADSSLRVKCFIQVQALEKKWDKLDSCTEKSIIKIGLLENRVSSLSILMIDVDDRIDLKIHEFTIKALTNEYGFIWDGNKKENTSRLDSAVAKTYKLNTRLYRYFFISKSNYWPHFASIFLLIAFFVWIITNKQKITRINGNDKSIFNQTPYVVKYPLLSTLTVACILSPYFYDHPAQVFSHTLLLVMMASIGLLIKNYWPKPLFRFWAALFITAIVFTLSSLLILITYADRIVLLVLSAFIIYQSITVLKQLKTATETYPPYTETVLKLFVALQGVSVLLNLAGRFSLAKLIGVTATLNLCLAMGFYLCVQILMESLFLQLEAGKNAKSKNITSYIDFKTLQKKFKDIIIKGVVILWLVALAKNLTIDDYIYDEANDFLNHPYKFSSTAFTFRSVLIFIVIIWISGLLARLISYFYDYEGQETKLTPQAKKTRSSILLIRLAVFVIGFFIAITAAGIPMDRVTIILGALGVGIGFGLQNIVNNLVSGIILAFEKPVQVGDIIEVSGKSGTIKEIGIRSSKIECGDGSELIVPNGDLISQHVVNWTLNNNNRRVELIIRVAYGSDVVKVEEILKAIISNREDIMNNPEPSVFLNNFSDSAIEFRAWFWAAEITRYLSLKSGVMREIYTEFAKEGIEIPQSQKEIQLLYPELNKEAKAVESTNEKS
ncbi:MAG: mechanosensitive ion channel family protein [Janthinobacterium lividum]